MKPTFIGWNSTRTRWCLASLVLFTGLLAGYLVFRARLNVVPDRPKPVDQLIRELRKQDTIMNQGWQVLWDKLPSRARRHLVRFEPKRALTVRFEACREIGRLRTDAAKVVPALILALNDSHPDVQRAAINALGEMGPLAEAARPDLIRLFKLRVNKPVPRKGEIICADAALALAMISPADLLVFHLLKEALLEKRPSGAASPVVVTAVSGLEKMAGARPEVIATLTSALPGSDARLRAQILRALGRIRQKPETVVPILIEALDSKGSGVQRSAILALGNFGPAAAPAVPALIWLAQEARASRRSELQSLRERAGGIDSLSDDRPRRDGLLPPASSTGIDEIAATLGRIGPVAKAAIPFLIEDYTDRANPLRYEAAFARWQIDGDTAAVAPVLLEGIRQSGFRARSAVIRRLREMGLEAVPILMAAFRDADGTVRKAAIESLAQIRPTLVLDPALLQSGINDSNLNVRVAMIRAVGACGAEANQVASLLKPLLNDPTFVIRKVTGEALNRICPANPSP